MPEQSRAEQGMGMSRISQHKETGTMFCYMIHCCTQIHMSYYLKDPPLNTFFPKNVT